MASMAGAAVTGLAYDLPEMEMTTVVVVGAGPAGLGCAALLKQCHIDCIVLERGRVGESFLRWPAETRFISPSFTGNFFGAPDLNAITPDSSPAYGLQTEHPTGAQYCQYLNDVVTTTKIDVRTNTEVTDVVGAVPQVPLPKRTTKGGPGARPDGSAADGPAVTAATVASASHAGANEHKHTAKEQHEHAHQAHVHGPNCSHVHGHEHASKAGEQAPDTNPDEDEREVDLDTIPTIIVETSKGLFGCKFLVWAGGEFQYPRVLPNTVRPGASYADMPVGKHVIIGGGESGMDAALNLIRNGSEVIVLDSSAPWAKRVSDSSYGLSPATLDNLKEIMRSGRATLLAENATEITKTTVTTASQTIALEHPAIDATGFDIKASLAGKLFDFSERGVPLLRMQDESSRLLNVFLAGPWVHHGKAVFCFVYKYRQRWAVVVRTILHRMGFGDPGPIRAYAARGFLLDDLSCCAQECVC